MKLNLTIRTKLIGGFSLLLVLASIFAAVSIWQVKSLQKLQTLTENKIVILAGLDSAMWELRFAFPFYMVTPDRRQAVRDAYPGQKKAITDGLQTYEDVEGLSAEERDLIEHIKETFVTWSESRVLLFQYFDEGKTEELAALRRGVTVTAANDLVASLKKLRELTDKTNKAAVAATQATGNIVMTLVGLLLAAIATVAAMYVYRGISRPLLALQETVDRVRAGEELKEGEGVKSQDEIGAIWRTVHGLLTDRRDAQLKAESENEQLNTSVISILQSVHQLSQRDLTVRAPVTQDVIGTVSDSINALTMETSKVLQGVSVIAGSVAQASDKVRSQAALVSKTAEDERTSVGHMIESLSTATQTMNQVAALAEQSNVSAGRATLATDAALDTVNGTVKGMESIRETIAETEKRIKRLGERSQEISGIVNLINTIAERTHVLALNASMQAAVAGEAGRGFAVVAEEVQRLAESSRTATQQISTLVNNIQLETNETISTVNRTITQVVQGSEQAQKAGDQMRVTQQITNELVAQVKRIAEVSEQQKAMSANLLSSVQLIGQSTERTADQMTAQNQETESLMQSARRLVESVNVFKLPQMA
jgi:methyl-accepting chemotaxis protein